jgi:hypothetical protein
MENFLIRLRYSFFHRYEKDRVFKIFFTVFGIIGFSWTLVECFSWIFEDTLYPASLRKFIREKLVWEAIIIVLASLFYHRRKVKIQKTFTNTDITIIVEFCDIFEQQGATVINAMDTFDTTTANNLVNPRTVYGQFITKYYPTNIQSLDNEISLSLSNKGFTPIQNDPKLKGKKDRYAIGTSCPITSHNKYFYLTALTFMTDTGNVDIQPQYIYDFLSNLWSFIPTHGDYHEIVNIPVIGTGLNRLPASYTHQFLLREIANSFFVSSKQKAVCKTLKICLHIKDYKYYDFDEVDILFNHIDKYLNR